MTSDPNKLNEPTEDQSSLASPDAPSLADDLVFQPSPGQTLTFALCVDFEAVEGDLFGRERSEQLRSVLDAAGFRCRDVRLSVAIRQIPSKAERDRNRRNHAKAAELARRSKESRELADRLLAKHGLRRD